MRREIAKRMGLALDYSRATINKNGNVLDNTRGNVLLVSRSDAHSRRKKAVVDKKVIPLTQGKNATVDVVDYEYLMQWKWTYTPKGPVRYRDTEACRKVSMRREVAARKGLKVLTFELVTFNKDGDYLNNTRNNVLLVTPTQARQLRKHPKAKLHTCTRGAWAGQTVVI